MGHTADNEAREAVGPEQIDVSFVVIGYNESRTLETCLRSAREGGNGLSHEVIYVDGGSVDDSLEIARAAADRVLGGEVRRRAAQNRNLGLASARGEYVQFIDGDMALHRDWPAAAIAYLRKHPSVGCVFGILNEANRSLIFQALQLDWTRREGPVGHCGGAAMWRREVLQSAGGFPENVAYGEEPYVCWYVRNDLGKEIHQIWHPMADHDLGFQGLRDYWRRMKRCGETYAEIAACFIHSEDRLWFREACLNFIWFLALCVCLGILAAGSALWRIAVLLFLTIVVVRKTLLTMLKGHGLAVSFVYALHTYFSKLPIGVGIISWLLTKRRAGVHKSVA